MNGESANFAKNVKTVFLEKIDGVYMEDEKLENILERLNEKTDKKYGIHFTHQIFGDTIVIVPDYIGDEYVGDAYESW